MISVVSINVNHFYAEEIQRIELYAERRKRSIKDQLGAGFDGIVVSTNNQTAIKALRYEKLYQRERDVYIRLEQHDIGEIEGFAVPRLIGQHDELWIIEMEIVSPPFVVDFAGAYLDEEPPYLRDPEVMSLWATEKREQFGDQWSEVKTLLAAFRRFGVYLADVKPGNVTFLSDFGSTQIQSPRAVADLFDLRPNTIAKRQEQIV